MINSAGHLLFYRLFLHETCVHIIRDIASIFECSIKPNVTMIQIETRDCLVSRVRSVRCISSKATYHTQWFVKFKARKLTRVTREGLF